VQQAACQGRRIHQLLDRLPHALQGAVELILLAVEAAVEGALRARSSTSMSTSAVVLTVSACDSDGPAMACWNSSVPRNTTA
jgi:hypothetical protein